MGPLIKHGWLRALLFFFFWIALQIGAGAGVAVALVKIEALQKIELLKEYPLLAIALTNIVVALLAVSLFRKRIDKQTIASLGFEWKGFSRHAFTGFFVALFILCASSLILLVFGHLVFGGIDFYPKGILLNIVIMLVVAVAEELTVRGYLLNNLLQSFPKWVALSISAGIFALLHLLNPNVTVISVICIFTAGILLGINYIYTRNLWFGIMFHFAWNFLLGPVFGFAVSGIETDSLLVQSVKGSNWLTGGSFGLEGSALVCILNAVAIAGLGYYYQRKANTSLSITA